MPTLRAVCLMSGGYAHFLLNGVNLSTRTKVPIPVFLSSLLGNFSLAALAMYLLLQRFAT